MKKELIETMQENGYTFLLPVQEKAIPAITSGRDLFIQAETGSGKTLAYLLPVLDRTDAMSDNPQALIITPTRELAMQVSETASKMALKTGHHVITLIGGLDIRKQGNALKHHPDVIIGTPGRLRDLLEQGKLNLHDVKITVLDEADQIIGTGQRQETEAILKQVHSQIVCTSATKTEDLLSFLPQDHDEIILHDSQVNEKIDAFYIDTEDRKRSLKHLLKTLPIERAIIFVNWKNDANELADYLSRKGVLVSAFSSFFEERERIRILKDFKKGLLRVLVATDAAARGLDVSGITHIIHYDVPLDAETFIHRSGRTAHQGNTGVTITLLRKKDADNEVAKYIREHSAVFNPEKTYETDLSQPLKQKEKTNRNSMTISIRAGRNDKLRPKDIIGALCSKMEFDEIGVLEIQDSLTSVVIKKYDPKLAKSLDGMTIKGKKRRVFLLKED